jgi:hypothetical protein
MRPSRRGHIDLALLQLGAQNNELVVIEIVFERESVEGVLVDRPTLLGVGEESLNGLVENDAQDRHFLSNRSMRLPLRAARSTPVYAGWQFEQTSRTSSGRFERVVNVAPHDVQRTVVSVSSGSICFREISSFVLGARNQRDSGAAYE